MDLIFLLVCCRVKLIRAKTMDLELDLTRSARCPLQHTFAHAHTTALGTVRLLCAEAYAQSAIEDGELASLVFFFYPH